MRFLVLGASMLVGAGVPELMPVPRDVNTLEDQIPDSGRKCLR
jgi:hypothetical protein